MKRSRAVQSFSPWPPQLWVTLQAKRIFAQELHTHTISVAAFIKEQLESARKDMLATITQTAALTEDDIQKMRSFTCLVKEFDARAAQHSFLYRKDDYQEEMREQFPGIQTLIHTFKVNTDFKIYYDPKFHLATYYDRSLKGIIFSVDGSLVLAHPHNNEYALRPELTIGPSFYQLSLDEQWGSLARQVAGHIALEHATERYVLNEILKKRKISTDKAKASLMTLRQLHALEADLVPASHDSAFAWYVLRWLKLQRNAPDHTQIKDRILNVNAVLDLHIEYDSITNKKY